VVSGGFGGLALVLVGSALLIADRLESTQANRATAAQGRLTTQVDDLHALVVAAANAGSPAGAGTVPQPAAQPPAQALPADDGSVYAVPGGRTFHRPGCELLAGKAAQRVEGSQVSGRGLSPCSVCAPILVG
jgi:hypothetical protein